MTKKVKNITDKQKEEIKKQFKYGTEFFNSQLSYKKDNDRHIMGINRDSKKVHVRSIFSILQSLLGILYIDKRKVEFGANYYEGEKIAYMFNKLAGFDYENMNKHMFDFMKVYYGVIYGIGITRIASWDKEENTPILESVHPMNIILDPKEFKNGKKREFIGVKKMMSKKDFEDHKIYSKHFIDFKQKKEIEIYHHYSRDYETNEVLLTTWTLECSKLLETKRFKRESGLWNTFGFSIFTPWAMPNGQFPDLIDLGLEYQKMISQITNLMLLQAKKDVLGEDRLINVNKVDIEQLTTGTVGGRNIPVELEDHENMSNAIIALPKEQPSQQAGVGLQILEKLKQEATGVDQLNQGFIPDKSMTKAEMQTIQSNSNAKFALLMGALMRSEETFWLDWQGFYRTYFRGKKNITFDMHHRTEYLIITSKDIGAGQFIVAGVKITSLSEEKKKKDQMLQAKISLMPNLMPMMNKFEQTLYMREVNELSGMGKDEALVYLPESLDEMQANADLELLNQGKEPSKPEPGQNHYIFETIFRQAIPGKNTTKAIIQRKLLRIEEEKIKKEQEAMMQGQENNMQNMANISQAQATSKLLNQDTPNNKVISNQDTPGTM